MRRKIAMSFGRTELPFLFAVDQMFQVETIRDIEAEIKERLATFPGLEQVRQGQRIGVAVGSRGIHDLATIVRTVVGKLKALGAQVTIIPAMGSHGGATAQGQVMVLEELGVTESSVGAPILSSMEVVSLGRVEQGLEVLVAKDALDMDHLVVVNRVKPHTAFRASVESGLCKMLAVGLGKKEGASEIHTRGLARSIVPAAKRILERLPVLMGVAILEGPQGGTVKVEVVGKGDFVSTDERLLEEAWRIFPKIPVEDLDVLIVDRMGKDISGAGMDPNVIGMWRREGGPRKPDYRTLVVLDLTPASHGNATGIGMADLTTRRLMRKVDLRATYTNALTSGVLRSARLPIALDSDRAAIEAALAHVPDWSDVRMARITDTLHLSRIWVSEKVARELEGTPNLSIHWKPLEIKFTKKGRIKPMET